MSSAVCPAGSTRKKFTLRVLPPSGCVSLFSVSVMDTSLKPVLENGLYVPILAVVAPETPQVSAAAGADRASPQAHIGRSEEHTSELQSLMRISYAVFCLKKKKPRKKSH